VPVSSRIVIPATIVAIVSAGIVSGRMATIASAAPMTASAYQQTDTARTSMDGVYTTAQATSGSDVFAAQCRSCHSPTVHSGPAFRTKWFGHTLGELYGYMRREMPKNDPGSMSDDDYAKALAYLLRINGMPAGTRMLSSDSATLHRIRLDSTRSVPSTQSSSR
jgi:S-disulfanyl-L-cysteine oxidoreductase SoxD